MARISAPTTASARTSSVSSTASFWLMRVARPSCARNWRKAWEVVAKPVGTRTPSGSCEIISPSEAFLPPTASTSVILRFSNGTTRSVGLKSADMEKLRKLKAGQRWHPATEAGKRACGGSRFVFVVWDGARAWLEFG